MSIKEADKHSVIGEECHIVAREKNGPRGDSALPDKFRDYPDNLILLCRIHHKIIDDQPQIFTVEVLFDIKSTHEAWVRESLSQKQINRLNYAYRIDNGTQLWNTVIQCDAYTFDNPHPKTQKEAELIGDFTQTIVDYGDIFNEINNRDKLQMQLELDKEIQAMEDAGFLIYAAAQLEQLSSKTVESFKILIGFVLILEKDNPIVQRKDDEIELTMMTVGQTKTNFSNFVPFVHDAKNFKFV
ncbi:MAG: hypothetical protein H6653_00010 [Ardenticatenaceae bacterium]|nr:hypothetical protein [Ardenticatenaceae bacterium]